MTVTKQDLEKNKLTKEFVLLFVLLPSMVIFYKLAFLMPALLWSATIYCAFIYKNHYFTNWKNLWNWQAVNWRSLQFMILRWMIASLMMLIFLFYYDPQRLFYLEFQRPQIIPFIFVFYPLLSALPQQFIFCSFFFERYRKLFPVRYDLVLSSALAFAFAHVLFINPIAPLFSLAGGIILALDYRQYKSLALVWIEHSLYGLSVFLIGLGWYFWTGSVKF